MRLHAYVLAADPAWIEESISSYYDLVDTIVVSYDADGRSWAGTELDPSEAIERARSVDRDGKMVLAPGHHALVHPDLLECDTRQRSAALARAGEGADWVLQIDTDEVVVDPDALMEAIEEADARGFDAVEYPMRYLYQHVRDDLYLERCRRFGRVATGYPGPVAVRAGAELLHCRQGPTSVYRVDLRARNTDPVHPRNAPVHRVVPDASAIFHYTWVRSHEDMHTKTSSWGHANDRDWGHEIELWNWAAQHPWQSTLRGLLSHFDFGRAVRPVRVPLAPDRDARRRNGLKR